MDHFTTAQQGQSVMITRTARGRILLVDHDPDQRRFLAQVICRYLGTSWVLIEIESLAEATLLLAQPQLFDIAVIDSCLSAHRHEQLGVVLLRHIRATLPHCFCILVTRYHAEWDIPSSEGVDAFVTFHYVTRDARSLLEDALDEVRYRQ